MTMPTLMAKHVEKQTVSQLAKAYSTISQAIQRVEAEYGTIDTWDLEDTITGQVDEDGKRIYDHSAQSLFVQRLKQYLNVSKTCEPNVVCDTRPTFSINGEKTSDSMTITNSADSPAEANFFLNDGTFIGLGYYTSRRNSIDLSVILPQKRIVLGKTKYYFIYTKKGLIPEGAPILVDMFSNAGVQPFTQCASNGRGCTAWVLYNKNLDYLHCPDKLGWDKASSCF